MLVNTTEHIVVGLIMVAGLAGVAVPVLPGLLLILAAALFWAIRDAGSQPVAHWIVFAIIAAVFLIGWVLKYLVPARRAAAAGATGRSMLFAVGLGIVGLFVIPIVGAPIGFVLGVYLAERRRLGAHTPAWRATVGALRGVGLSMLIEFCAGVLMIAVWLVGVLVL